MEYNSSKRKEEKYSQVVRSGKRTYFFDVKENKNGSKYIVITESRKIFKSEEGKFVYEKDKIFLYKEDFKNFLQNIENVIDYIETGEAREEIQIPNDDDLSFDIDNIFNDSI